MKRFFIGFIFITLLIYSCKPIERNNKKTITIKGSDTMVNLTQKWAETYMKENEDLSIQVTGGGSGTGIAALLNGTANIANISRELKEKEIEKAAKRGIVPRRFRVALDGIAVVVNPVNPIDTLSLEQLRNIFSGKIKNWKDIGGKDERIVLYGRENSSGTYEYFKEIVLGRNENEKQIEFTPSTQVLQGTAALGEAVSRDIRGIGYGGVGYFANRNDLKTLFIKSADNAAAISPLTGNEVNYEAIRNGGYPLSRYLYCYTNGEPEGAVKNYLDFILSVKGQNIVKEMEYIPLPAE